MTPKGTSLHETTSFDILSVKIGATALGVAVAAGKGRRGHAPCAALYRGGIWKGKIWNSEIWPLLVNWRLHCRVIFLYHPNTLPGLGPQWHPLTVSAPRTRTKQCVYHQETYANLIDHSPVEDPYCPIAVFTIHVFPNSAEIWKFCMKFAHLILRKIFKFVADVCQILRLKCTKFNFGWGSLRPRARGALQRCHRHFSWI